MDLIKNLITWDEKPPFWTPAEGGGSMLAICAAAAAAAADCDEDCRDDLELEPRDDVPETFGGGVEGKSN